MRNEDLIPCFVDELRRITGGCPRCDEIEARMENEDYFETEEASYDVEALFDSLNEYAPAFCYFGSHPGDGSDYGFWVCEDFEQMILDEGGIKVSDTGEIPDGFDGYVMQISDHGNCTLYYSQDGKNEEVWSIV
jgi:hypothetical protein